MNILIDDLPEEIGGVPIRSDYRYMVMFEELIQEPEYSNEQKVLQSIDLLYDGPVPDLKKAWDGVLWFYSGGCTGQGTAHQSAGKFRPVYDFNQDAERIYAAFWQIYRLDLQSAPLHWWTFRALLGNLPETCLMGEIMRIRATDAAKLKGAEQKRIRQLQRIYAIKRPETHVLLTAAEQDRRTREKVLQRFKEAEEWKKRQK